MTLPNEPGAAAYGQALLYDLGYDQCITGAADHPALSWKRSGLQELTGPPSCKGWIVPVPISQAADGVMLALKQMRGGPDRLPINGAVLLGERARLMRLRRNGTISAGGECRILPTEDGMVAVNLAREEDWGLVPAWLEAEAGDWDFLAELLTSKNTREIVARGREIGLAVSLSEESKDARSWVKRTPFTPDENRQRPVVVDLSSLWAGPLVGSLLGMMGARVIKVESASRPDGARRGHAGFYTLLNGGKECAAFDFSDPADLASLKRLLAHADIVIEGSRPRALRQLGIYAEEFLTERPGLVWLGLTAYGRDGDEANWIGFGDDVGVAAGLSRVMEQVYGHAVFVGDAIADPLTGLHAALAAWVTWKAGGGSLIDMAMKNVVRHAMGDCETDLSETAHDWQEFAVQDQSSLYPMRGSLGIKHEIGQDTDAVLSSPC